MTIIGNGHVAMYIRCLHGQSPRYFADLCVPEPVAYVSSRQHLQSATRRLLVVPRCRLSTLDPRPSLWPARRFATLCQTAWEIRILARTASGFCWIRIYLHYTEAFSVLEMFQDDMLYELTYLLTYLLKVSCTLCAWHVVNRAGFEMTKAASLCLFCLGPDCCSLANCDSTSLSLLFRRRLVHELTKTPELLSLLRSTTPQCLQQMTVCACSCRSVCMRVLSRVFTSKTKYKTTLYTASVCLP